MKTFKPVKLEMDEPFTVAYGTIDHTVNIFFQIETDFCIIGFGCAAHDEGVTGENEKTILKALNNVATQFLPDKIFRTHQRFLMKFIVIFPTRQQLLQLWIWQ